MAQENTRTQTISVIDDSRFAIESMKPEDYDECRALAVESFLKNNPVIIHLKVSAEEMGAEFDKEVKSSLAQGLPMVARDRTNGKLAGFLFSSVCDFYTPPNDRTLASTPLFDAAEKLYLEAVTKTKIGASAIVRGKCLRVGIGATADGYQGMGVGKLLRCSVLAYAEERGFERVLSEPAHPATTHIWTKNAGFHLRASMKLSAFEGKEGATYSTAPNPYPFQGCDTEFSVVEGITKHGIDDSRCCLCWWLTMLIWNCKPCCFAKYVRPDGLSKPLIWK